MNATNTQELVQFSELKTTGGHRIGIATLTREKALNSLLLETIDLLAAQFEQWSSMSDLVCIVINSSSERAFCAGADIQALYRSCIDTADGVNDYAENFFSHEYALDFALHQSAKPVLVWGNGIVMGGGLGLLGGCSHRVGNPDTRIAMPEITIGLFPDAGGTYFLSKMPSHLGLFMGLTGCQITAGDALSVGLLDVVIASEDKSNVLQGLEQVQWSGEPEADCVVLTDYLSRFTVNGPLPLQLLEHEASICSLLDRSFAAGDFFEVFQAGLTDLTDDPWIQQAATTFMAGSPTTAHIFIEQMRRAESMSLADMFRMELVIAYQCIRHAEFPEGVRALMIDKDKNPIWKHAAFTDVPKDWIAEFFQPSWSGSHPLSGLQN